MSSHSMSAGSHADAGPDHGLLGQLALRLQSIRATFRQRAAARRLCDQLQGLDNRMLLDIGLQDSDIARLRAGERFIPATATSPR